MNFIYTLILSVIQAITEFVPISSSGHIILLLNYIENSLYDGLLMQIALHFGTLCAIFLFYSTDIIHYIKAFINSVVKRQIKSSSEKLSWYFLLSAIPAGLAGLFLEDFILSLWGIPIIITTLFIGGVLFLLVEKYHTVKIESEKLTLKEAGIISCAQAFALIPGVSRSGITIISGMSLGLSRKDAARFSFLMSLPIIFAATLKKLYDVSTGAVIVDVTMLTHYALAFLCSFILGYIVIKYFISFLSSHSLKVFAYYRIILAGILFFIFIL